MADEPETDPQPEDTGPHPEGEGSAELSLGGTRPSMRNMPYKKASIPQGDDSSDKDRGQSENSEEAHKAEDAGSGGEDENKIHGEEPHQDDPHHDDHDPYHDEHHDYDHDHDDYHHDHDYEDYHHEHEEMYPHDPDDDWWEEDEKDEEDELPPEGEMSLLDHLEDLRWTLFKSVGALMVGCLVVGLNVRYFADILKQPIQYAVDNNGGRVLVVSENESLYSINPRNGKKVWEFSDEEGVRSKPLLGEKVTKDLYAVVGDNSVVALHRRKGEEKWRYQAEGKLDPDTLRIGGGEFLYVSSVGGVSDTGGAVHAIKAKTGKLEWKFPIGEGLAYAPVLDMDQEDIDLRTRQPLGVMMVLMQVVFFGGLAISLPFIVMFASGFVAPGLTKREKRMLLPGSVGAVVLFLMGAALAFFFIVPVSLKFSTVLNEWLGIQLMWDVNDYYSLVVMVTLAVGALFQFPLLLVILGYLGVLSSSKLKGARQIVFVIILIVAALLTPGDVIVALVLLTVPLYALFEGSILMVAYVEKAKAKKQARIEARRKAREEARQQSRKKAQESLKQLEPENSKDKVKVEDDEESTEGDEKQK